MNKGRQSTTKHKYGSARPWTARTADDIEHAEDFAVISSQHEMLPCLPESKCCLEHFDDMKPALVRTYLMILFNIFTIGRSVNNTVIKLFSFVNITRSSAVAEKPRDASCDRVIEFLSASLYVSKRGAY